MGMAEFSSVVMILTMARTLLLALLAFSIPAHAQSFEPYEGQPGKDVVWVPTRPALAEKMLDLAGITPQDFVIDLGSGDGRLVIAAAKRGARARCTSRRKSSGSRARWWRPADSARRSKAASRASASASCSRRTSTPAACAATR